MPHLFLQGPVDWNAPHIMAFEAGCIRGRRKDVVVEHRPRLTTSMDQIVPSRLVDVAMEPGLLVDR